MGTGLFGEKHPCATWAPVGRKNLIMTEDQTQPPPPDALDATWQLATWAIIAIKIHCEA